MGQCYKMVVEMRPFFPFKNRPFQSYGTGCMTCIDVKLVSQIWQILLKLGFQFEYKAEICQSSFTDPDLVPPNMSNSQTSHCEMRR
jgi:hypothetical protein